MRCSAPAWVGAGHALIVRSASGGFERIAVGDNWVRYRPPAIARLSPAKVRAPGPVSVTVLGTDFGAAAADVRGALELEGGGSVPCEPPPPPPYCCPYPCPYCTLTPSLPIRCEPLVLISDTTVRSRTLPPSAPPPASSAPPRSACAQRPPVLSESSSFKLFQVET